MQNYKYLQLMALASWLSITLIIDFLVAPNIFRMLTNLEEAGRLGMHFFSTFNYLELFFAFFGSIGIFLGIKKSIWQKLCASILVTIALFYTIYLSPKINELTNGLHKLANDSEAYQKLEQVHHFYHRLYVQLDSVKIIALIILIILLLKERSSKDKGLII